jgi:hypothetical protein
LAAETSFIISQLNFHGSGANARVAGDDEEMQRFVPIEDLFKGRHFDRQIIVLCVSWYTSFKLSLRDLVIMMADRGISVTHTTILRWVQRYLPEFEKRWRRYAGIGSILKAHHVCASTLCQWRRRRE